MTPKITAVAPGDRVAVPLGAADGAGVAVAPGVADLAGVAVAPGPVAPGPVAPGTLVPQDTVTRTTAAGSSRRRPGPIDRILVIFAWTARLSLRFPPSPELSRLAGDGLRWAGGSVTSVTDPPALLLPAAVASLRASTSRGRGWPRAGSPGRATPTRWTAGAAGRSLPSRRQTPGADALVANTPMSVLTTSWRCHRTELVVGTSGRLPLTSVHEAPPFAGGEHVTNPAARDPPAREGPIGDDHVRRIAPGRW